MRSHDSGYRDPLQGLRARVQDLARDVAEREASMTAELFDHLPKKLAEALRDHRARSTEILETEAALVAAERSLLGYRAALDRAFELAPDLEAAQKALPRDVPDPDPRADAALFHLFDSDVYLETCESVARTLRVALDKVAEDVAYTSTAENDLRVRFRAFEAPFKLRAAVGRLNSDAPVDVFVAMATSVARGVRPLRLRAQTGLHSVGKFLGLVHDAEVGDEDFDDLFVIDADPANAERLLTKPVRQGLLAVAHFDVPTLEVGHGVALLRFRFEPTERALRGAAQALAGIRGAPVPVELVR